MADDVMADDVMADDVGHIHIIASNSGEPQERIAGLQQAGYRVSVGVPGPPALREIRESPPAAVLIDLTR